MFLLIDNYDSFTYNLHHYFMDLGCDIAVHRNDQISLDDIRTMQPEGIILSPGPKTPDDAGICLDVVKAFAPTIPILGVCLGHQSIGQVFGGTVCRAPYVMHGKTSPVLHQDSDIFRGLPSPATFTRYHSLVVKEDSIDTPLVVTATTEDGLVMGLRHETYPCFGVQFHPESIASELGHDLLRNFVSIAQGFHGASARHDH